jgi:hypothetical protein
MYRRGRRDLNYETAKEVLGFPPGSSPTDDEIRHVQRVKIVELGHDRGGDIDAIKEVNAAAEILLGKLKPDRGPDDIAEPYVPRGGPPPPEEKPIIITFQEALAKISLPSSVTWKFVTDKARGRGWASDESESRHVGYVAVGETPNFWVFVAVEERSYQAFFVGGGPKTHVFRMKVYEQPNKGTPTPAFLYGGVMKAWKFFEKLDKRFNSKIHPLAEDWTFLDFAKRFPLSRATTIKNWLVDTGVVEEATLAKPRKIKVEIKYVRLPSHMMPPDAPRSAEDHFVLIVNGKEDNLSPKDDEALSKLRIGGKRFAERVFGEYHYGGEIRDLTRNRDGKTIMSWMAEHLIHLPEFFKNSLLTASGGKTATERVAERFRGSYVHSH